MWRKLCLLNFSNYSELDDLNMEHNNVATLVVNKQEEILNWKYPWKVLLLGENDMCPGV